MNTVEVYGKKGCGLCDRAKDKLRSAGLSYKYFEIATLIEPHDGWRADNSVDVLAAHLLYDGKIPLIKINGATINYTQMMKTLKNETNVQRSLVLAETA